MTTGRHIKKHKTKPISMRIRPVSVPATWRTVDFRGVSFQGCILPAPGTHRMEFLRLVLDAENIPHIITGHGQHMRAYVPALFEYKARIELADAAAENIALPASIPIRHNAHWTMLILLAILIWHGLRVEWWSCVSGMIPVPETWMQIGKLDVALVRSGEWWRTVTALTLHTDSLHIFNNIVFASPFLILLAQRLGLPIAICGTLLSGMLANTIEVLYRSPGYSSLGFSTAMFSTVGMLCADILIRTPQTGIRKYLLPVATGTAFLALLGTGGQNTDYAAHIFGLISGFMIGTIFSCSIKHFHGIPINAERVLGISSLLFITFCWYLAF
jgi:membrane associated rhomboid family serine protease